MFSDERRRRASHDYYDATVNDKGDEDNEEQTRQWVSEWQSGNHDIEVEPDSDDTED